VGLADPAFASCRSACASGSVAPRPARALLRSSSESTPARRECKQRSRDGLFVLASEAAQAITDGAVVGPRACRDPVAHGQARWVWRARSWRGRFREEMRPHSVGVSRRTPLAAPTSAAGGVTVIGGFDTTGYSSMPSFGDDGGRARRPLETRLDMNAVGRRRSLASRIACLRHLFCELMVNIVKDRAPHPLRSINWRTVQRRSACSVRQGSPLSYRLKQ
jgi:hypothetical protein